MESCLLWQAGRVVRQIFRFSGIRFQIVQFARPLPDALHVLQVFRSNAAHIAVFKVEPVLPTTRSLATEEGCVASSDSLRIGRFLYAEILENCWEEIV